MASSPSAFSQIKSVQSYIAKQGEHHRKASFQDEFRQLLRRYEIQLDERYLGIDSTLSGLGTSRRTRAGINAGGKNNGLFTGECHYLAQSMNRRRIAITWCLATVLLGIGLPSDCRAKGYSSHGGHSYSSHSSSYHGGGFSSSRSSSYHSSSGRSPGGNSSHNSGNKSFSSGSGRSYSSGSIANDSNSKSYSSGKSYSSSDGKYFGAPTRRETPTSSAGTTRTGKTDSGGFAFDTAAARARKEEASREQFTQYKQAQNPPAALDAGSGRAPAAAAPRWGGSSGSTIYVPDRVTISTRPIRIYNVFNPYSYRPWVVYRDPYSSLFWWWLLDRSLDDRAWWAYHHRYDMDPARYDALMATDAQLQARVSQLEAQQAARDPNYVPPGLDGRDLMYSDNYVNRAYSNRSTTLGVIAFWVFGIPMALGMCVLFIWLIWFKRWQTAT